MTRSDGPKAPEETCGQFSGSRRAGEPGWAMGLRKLYKSVVDEPLPDSFDDLLKKLDEKNG